MPYMLIFMFEGFALFEMGRRIGVAKAATLCNMYIFVMQIYFIGFSVTFEAGALAPGSYGAFYYDTLRGFSYYFLIFLIIYTSTIGVQKQKFPNGEGRRIKINFSKIKSAMTIAVWVSFSFAFMRLMSINFESLWFNTEYLYIGSDDGMWIANFFSKTVRSTSTIFMAVVGVTFAMCHVAGFRKLQILSFVSLLIFTVISLAGASRSSCVGLLAVAVTYAAIGRSRHRFYALFCVFVSLTFIVSALYGRGLGLFGISAIPFHFAWLYDGSMYGIVSYTVRNFVQGIFVTTDSIYVGGEHDIRYKILSFSIFPGSIDGFQQIRSALEIRLHKYVPMSAFGEAWNFGPFWAALFFFVVFIVMRKNSKPVSKGIPALSIITTAIIFFTFVQANAYPIRSVFRQFLLCYVIMTLPAVFDSVLQAVLKSKVRARAGQ